MTEPVDGVILSDPPSDPQEPATQDPEPTSVNVDVTPEPQDRPVENLKAEFDRKFGGLSQQLNDLMAILASGPASNQPKPNAPVEYSNEQLAELARAGSVEASLKLQERVATQAAQSVVTADRAGQMVQSQLASLYAKYPQLTNQSDPLTVEAMKAKHVLLRTGKPNTGQTDLEAIMLAIVDNHHLVQSKAIANPDYTRRASVTPQSGMDGNTPRRSTPQSNGPKRKIDPKALAIAQRMGIKDPDKAIANFEERYRKGRTGLSPTVALIVREEG